MKKYIEYAKFNNANQEVLDWIERNLANYLEKNSENQAEIEHIIDYLVSDKAPKECKGYLIIKLRKKQTNEMRL
jgi:hypothetical protein